MHDFGFDHSHMTLAQKDALGEVIVSMVNRDDRPLILIVDGDVGTTLGRIVRDEIARDCNVVSVDGIQLQEFDYVNAGAPMRPANVVSVVIKSLLF